MSEMLLLGAGASIEAGVPGAIEMTNRIVEVARNKHEFRRQARALSYVVGGLVFDQGKQNANPLTPSINVETLFNAVKLLAERKRLEAAPFISSWDSFVEELDRPISRPPRLNLIRSIYEAISRELQNVFSEQLSSFSTRAIDEAVRSTITQAIENSSRGFRSSSSTANVGNAIEKCIRDIAEKWRNKLRTSVSNLSGNNSLEQSIDQLILASQNQDGDGSIFEQTNRMMISVLKDLVWIENSSQIEYLSPLIGLLNKQTRLVVTTLNYDNSIELLAQSNDLDCNTCISQWSQNGSIDISGKGLHLLKLHGSIDWELSIKRKSQLLLQPSITQIDKNDVKNTHKTPAVIFGNRNKLTADGPYLELLRNFQAELLSTHTLTVVGYSFRDAHVNVFISQWINRNKDNKLQIINGPNFEAAYEHSETGETSFANSLREASRNSSQITFIPQYAARGLADIFGPRPGSSEQISFANNQSAVDLFARETASNDEPNLPPHNTIIADN